MNTQLQASAPAYDGPDSAFGKLLLAGHTGGISAAAFSPDGQTLVTSGTDGLLLFWDLPSMKLRRAVRWSGKRFSDEEPRITDLTYSPDGAYIAASDWNQLYLLDPATGHILRKLSQFNKPFAFSPGGKLIACSAYQDGRDSAFALFNIHTRRTVATVGCDSQIDSVDFSADGEIFGVTSYTSSEQWYDSDGRHHSDGAFMVTVCDTATGGILHQWCWEEEIKIAGWPRIDGPRLLVFVRETATLWDAETGSVFEYAAGRQRFHSATHQMRSLSFASHGPFFITFDNWQAAAKGEIGLWSIGNNEDSPAYELKTQQSNAGIIDFTLNGSRFATSGADSAIKIWDIGNDLHLKGTLGVPQASLQEIAFDEESTSLRIRFAPGALCKWNIATGEVGSLLDIDLFGGKAQRRVGVGELSGDWLSLAQPLRGMSLGDPYRPVAIFSADGCFALTKSSQALTYDAPANACLWDVAARRPVAEIKELPSGNHFHARFSLDGAWIAISVDYETIRLLDGRTGEFQRELTIPARAGRKRDIFEEAISFAFSPDGRTLASGHVGVQVCLWDLRSGRLKRQIHADRDSVTALSFAPDGKSLAVGTSYWEKFLVYSLGRGARKRILRGHTGSLESIAYSPNGRWLASAADDGAVQLWDAASLECVATLRLLPDGGNLLLYPDGFYSGSEGAEQFLRVRQGEKITEDEQIIRQFRRPVAIPV